MAVSAESAADAQVGPMDTDMLGLNDEQGNWHNGAAASLVHGAMNTSTVENPWAGLG